MNAFEHHASAEPSWQEYVERDEQMARRREQAYREETMESIWSAASDRDYAGAGQQDEERPCDICGARPDQACEPWCGSGVATVHSLAGCTPEETRAALRGPGRAARQQAELDFGEVA